MMTKYNPALGNISEDNKIRVLLAAYQKNAAELLAIEASQEKLISLVLGIYSAGLTLLTALLKDAKSLMQSSEHQPSLFSWALIVVAILIGGCGRNRLHQCYLLYRDQLNAAGPDVE